MLHRDIDLFWKCWNEIELKAWVILPDHFHIIINVGGYSISALLHRFKIKYSRLFRQKYRPGRVWQNRFWEHIIRDQKDLKTHLDYIHYNPVKHGYTDNPFIYKYSSLGKYHDESYYSGDWGVQGGIIVDGEFGE